MATAASPSSGMPKRPTYACIRCSDRKVKCDHQRPCGNCLKHSVDCIYNPSRPPRKRQQRVRDQILTDRLKKYEAILQEHGIEPGKIPDTPTSEPPRPGLNASVDAQEIQMPTPSSIESEPHQSISKTQVVHGQGRSQFFDNSLWTRVVEEFHDPEDALEDSSNDASDLEASDDDLGFVLSSWSKSKPKSRHPPPEVINQLCEIFIERVDPLTKTVHVPTLRPAVQKAARNTEAIPRSFEALMFAMYSAAAMSMKDDECRQSFGEPRKSVLSRFISGTKAALSRAKFMGTNSLIVLQALVVHLLSVRDTYEPRVVWSLTGVAVRIAQSMGLERDGTSLGLPPFETEMRRRIWWLLKTHDFRTAELCGLPKFRDIDISNDSTKFPTNVNDDQLHPGTLSIPAGSDRTTDMVFVALRYEMTNFAAARIAKFRQQGKEPSKMDLHASFDDKAKMDEAVKGIEDLIETKYIRYCDPGQPLHLMTMMMARSSMDVIRFLLHHPRRWASIEQTPVSERQFVWELSVKSIDRINTLQSNPLLKDFAWHAPYFLQWHAFIHILDTIRANPLNAEAEKAWNVIGNTYKNNPSMIFDTKPIHAAVGNLTLKSYQAREIALENRSLPMPQTPDCILQLRQQRENAKARRIARNARINQSEDSNGRGEACAGDPDQRPDGGILRASDTLASTHLQQSTAPHSLNLGQAGDDPFSFINAFDGSQGENSNEAMDMDLDFTLAHGSSVEDNAVQTIDWEQWDTWLAQSNNMRP